MIILIEYIQAVLISLLSYAVWLINRRVTHKEIKYRFHQRSLAGTAYRELFQNTHRNNPLDVHNTSATRTRWPTDTVIKPRYSHNLLTQLIPCPTLEDYSNN